MLDVSVVDVGERQGSGSRSFFCELPTAVVVFAFGVACASVVGGCAAFLFILCLVTMEWDKYSISVLIPVMRSWVV